MTTQKITKISYQDIFTQLQNEFQSSEYGYAYVTDFDVDKGLVYVATYSDGKEYYAYKFTIDGVSVEIDDSTKQEVIPTTTWNEVPEDDSPVTMSKLKSFFKNLLPTKQAELVKIQKFNDEEMVAVEKLYIVPETFDAHSHTISEQDTELMVKSFNESLSSGKLKSSLFHTHETSVFKTLRAWVNPIDCYIGDTFVKKGQPLCENKFFNKAAWEDRKKSTLAGVSIGCRAKLVDVDGDE